MPQDPNRLIWIDLEMTGLKPDSDRVLEMALVITDHDLVTVAVAPVWVVRQQQAMLDAMDSWNRSTHGRSGLIDKALASTLDFLRQHVPPKVSPMCGNSICQDRRFLARWMPTLEDYFHYRNLDVSTLKELARRWNPEVLKGIPKEGKHEALADVYESIAESRPAQRVVRKCGRGAAAASGSKSVLSTSHCKAVPDAQQARVDTLVVVDLLVQAPQRGRVRVVARRIGDPARP